LLDRAGALTTRFSFGRVSNPARSVEDRRFVVIGQRFISSAKARKRSIGRIGRPRLVVSLAALASLALASAGCDWTQLGYDSGHSGFNWTENTISPTNVGELKLAWTTGSDTGSIHSSPVVAGGEVFLGGDNGRLMAFPVSCGSGGAVCHPSWEGAYAGATHLSAPAVDNGNVFVDANLGPSTPPALLAFPQSGNGSTCTTDIPSVCAPVSHFALQLGYGSSVPRAVLSPAVADGLVWIGVGQVSSDAGELSTVLGLNETLSGGAWLGASPGRNDVSDVTVGGGMVYVKLSNDTIVAYRVSNPSGDVPVPPAWTSPDSFDGASPPAEANGVVFSPGGDGTLRAYSAESGLMLWSAAIPGGGALATPAVANGNVYVGQANAPAGHHAKLYVFPVSGCYTDSCQPVWTGTTHGTQITASPTVANGLVYVGSGHPGAVDAFPTDGCGLPSCPPLSTFILPSGNVTTPAIVANGAVYVGSDSPDHGFYALTLGPGTAGPSSIATAAHTTTATPARRFAGTGPGRLGTITVREPTTLRWTARTGARVSFTVNGQPHQIAARGESGQIALPPDTYRNVRIITKGRWSFQLRTSAP
jgi:hypothetical protein